MKRLLLSLTCLVATVSMAEALDIQLVNRSSFTQTNESKYLAANYLDKIIVGATSSGGSLKIYNSTHTTDTLISSVTLTAGTVLEFDDLKVSGLYYVTGSNTNGVTIIYKNR